MAISGFYAPAPALRAHQIDARPPTSGAILVTTDVGEGCGLRYIGARGEQQDSVINMTSNGDDSGRGRSDGHSRGPGALGDMFDRLLGDDNPVLQQIDRNARALAQTALAKLDVVSRAEFDAQTAVLQRTRQKVELLEAEVERLTATLQAREKAGGAE